MPRVQKPVQNRRNACVGAFPLVECAVVRECARARGPIISGGFRTAVAAAAAAAEMR